MKLYVSPTGSRIINLERVRSVEKRMMTIDFIYDKSDYDRVYFGDPEIDEVTDEMTEAVNKEFAKILALMAE